MTGKDKKLKQGNKHLDLKKSIKKIALFFSGCAS
jgi:hypothetical protein